MQRVNNVTKVKKAGSCSVEGAKAQEYLANRAIFWFPGLPKCSITLVCPPLEFVVAVAPSCLNIGAPDPTCQLWNPRPE